MILRITLLLAIACLPLPAEDQAVVRFVNGDQLSGTPLVVDHQRVVWDSSLIERPIPFQRDKLLDISLPAQTPEIAPADHEAVVTLNKGGVIRGQLAQVTERAIVLDTWYAGRLEINRLMVANVQIEPSDVVIYRGPSSLKDWKISPHPDAWKYENFSFISAAGGSISREDLLTDQCSISFDAEWDSDAASYKVVIFADGSEERAAASGYEFSLQRGGMVLRNLRTQTFIGNTQSAVMAQSNRARIEIKASRTTGKIAFYVNDRIIDMWTDADVARSQLGKILRFSTERRASLKISRIRIAEWDGVIDDPPPPRAAMRRMFGFGQDPVQPAQPPPAKEAEGRMKLANGDSLDGKVTAITDGKVKIDTTLGSVTLPVSRLRTISLPDSAKEEAIARNGDVRAWFADGSHIVFDFIGSDESTITGRSQNFGTATFRRDAFQKIEFNIYDFELDELRKDTAW